MSFTTAELFDVLREYGELMVVLESDREYTLHPHDTEFDSESGMINTRGIPENGDEYQKVTFPAERVEHYYAHAEV